VLVQRSRRQVPPLSQKIESESKLEYKMNKNICCGKTKIENEKRKNEIAQN
jgi:hypothetical protein